MKVVVLNAGSGSQKCSLFELPAGPLSDEPLDPISEAKLDSISSQAWQKA
jgi:acetate kinase